MAQSKAKTIIFGIALALILVFFIAYATYTLYPEPNYEDFCGKIMPLRQEITNSTLCSALNGTWAPSYPPQTSSEGTEIGYCDLYQECNQKHNDTRQAYERNIFILNIVLGLVILITAFIIKVEVVSSGLMGGGAILMIYGTIRYWGELSNLLRTVILGLTLIILIYIGYKKFK